jgi:hypothetical protein
METVTVTVDGGPSATVEWTEGMTALLAMERARAVIEPDPTQQFTFCLQFYGADLGYLVCMINETYDSFISRGGEHATPFFYWHFFVNRDEAGESVDHKRLNPGDVVRFSFEIFPPQSGATSITAAKFRHQTK